MPRRSGERIRNERCVELAFEGHHYYHDIRRWKIAPQKMTATLMGMYVEKTEVSEQYPAGAVSIRDGLCRRIARQRGRTPCTTFPSRPRRPTR